MKKDTITIITLVIIIVILVAILTIKVLNKNNEKEVLQDSESITLNEKEDEEPFNDAQEAAKKTEEEKRKELEGITDMEEYRDDMDEYIKGIRENN